MIMSLPQVRFPEIHSRPVSLPKYHKQFSGIFRLLSASFLCGGGVDRIHSWGMQHAILPTVKVKRGSERWRQIDAWDRWSAVGGVCYACCCLQGRVLMLFIVEYCAQASWERSRRDVMLLAAALSVFVLRWTSVELPHPGEGLGVYYVCTCRSMFRPSVCFRICFGICLLLFTKLELTGKRQPGISCLSSRGLPYPRATRVLAHFFTATGLLVTLSRDGPFFHASTRSRDAACVCMIL